LPGSLAVDDRELHEVHVDRAGVLRGVVDLPDLGVAALGVLRHGVVPSERDRHRPVHDT